MKCDKCQTNEATVHEVMIKGGKRHEKHLCEQCAKSEGVAPQVVVHTPITQLLTQYITAQAEQAVAAGAGGVAGTPGAAATKCACCGLSYAHFRTTGLLGCPECYAAFEQQLTPLLARAHEGGTSHAGKSPARTASQAAGVSSVARKALEAGELRRVAAEARAAKIEAQKRLIAERCAALQKQLTAAVEAEQYEKAAKLRDEIAALQAESAALAEPPPAPKKARRAASSKSSPDSVERRTRKPADEDRERRQEPGAGEPEGGAR